MQSKEKLFNFCNSLIDDYTPAAVVLSGIATAAIAQLRNAAFGAVQIIMLSQTCACMRFTSQCSNHLSAKGSHHVCRFVLFST